MSHDSQRRILLLIQMLYEQTDDIHHVSTTDILRMWENHGIHSDRKGVYSDIQLLIELGHDIVCVKSSQNRYFVASRLFELPELKLLADAAGASKSITTKKTCSIIKKLSRLACVHSTVYIGGVNLSGDKSSNESVYYAIDAIQHAIEHRKSISFFYNMTPSLHGKHGAKGRHYYVLSPHSLLWHRDFYYLLGWSTAYAKAMVFRVDLITSVNETEDRYIEMSVSQSERIDMTFGDLNTGVRRITLIFHAESWPDVLSAFGKTVNITRVDGQHFRAIIELVPSPAFYARVFSFGGFVQIESPAEVLAEMRKMASSILNNSLTV